MLIFKNELVSFLGKQNRERERNNSKKKREEQNQWQQHPLGLIADIKLGHLKLSVTLDKAVPGNFHWASVCLSANKNNIKVK